MLKGGAWVDYNSIVIEGKVYRSHVADDPNFGTVSHFAFPDDGSNAYNMKTGNFVKGSRGTANGYPKINTSDGSKVSINRRCLAECHSKDLPECPSDPFECPSECLIACLSSQCCLPLGTTDGGRRWRWRPWQVTHRSLVLG